MFELFLELSKKHSLRGNSKSSTLFQHLLIGPILLIATFALAFLKIYIHPVWNDLWTVGFVASITLSLTIIVLSLREGALTFSKLVIDSTESQEREKRLQKELDELKISSHNDKEALQHKLEAIRTQLKEAERRAQNFEELTSVKKYEWEALEEEREALYQQSISTQAELEASLKENERLAVVVSGLHEELATRQEIPEPPHPYEEVRKQFEEKSSVLNATRKELFTLEGKYLALQMELEDKLLEPKEDLQALLSQFNTLETYCSRLEDDLAKHQELLTELSTQKPAPKKRKTTPKKVKVDASLVEDLFAEKTQAKK